MMHAQTAAAPIPSAMSLPEVTRRARDLAAEMTGAPVDGVALCQKEGDSWRVEIDVIESAARLGDDDLLTAYRLDISPVGDLIAFRRIGRHKRSENTYTVD